MRQLVLSIVFLWSGIAFCQQNKTTDFLNEIAKQDISYLWTLSRFQPERETSYFERKEQLGYLGDNFQRFYIHFLSAIQNSNHPLNYYIYGKTRIKENIYIFQGEIEIKEACLFNSEKFPELKQGYLKGKYHFYETPKTPYAGQLSGSFVTNFYIDTDGKIKYDALDFVNDRFCNNQFEGVYICYQTNETRVCNWGDYRIPNSKELDCGHLEFFPREEYLSNGWQPYALEHSENKYGRNNGYPDTNDKWWK